MMSISNLLYAGALGAYLLAAGLYIRRIALLQRGEFPVERSQRVTALAFRLHLAGVIGHGASFTYRWLAAGQPPVSTPFEHLSLLGWSVMLFLIPLSRGGRLAVLAAFSAPLGVILTAYAILFPLQPQPLAPALQSFWLVLQVMSSALGAGALAIGCSAAVMYLLRMRTERRCWWEELGVEGLFMLVTVLAGFSMLALGFRWSGYQATLGPGIAGGLLYILLRIVNGGALRELGSRAVAGLSPAALDEISYRGVAAGFPLLTLGAVVFALIHGQQAWGSYWTGNPAQIWALISWLLYAGYLHVRTIQRWEGRPAAWVACVGFPLTLFAMVGANALLRQ